MQVREKTSKKIGRPGFTDKRFWIRDSHKKAVEDFQKQLEAKQRKDLKWEQVLEYVIETHPSTKKFMSL